MTLDDTTIRPSGRGSSPALPPPRLHLTVLWHPDPARAGEMAIAPEHLSRLEPVFAHPGGRGTPLADPRLSRAAVAIEAGGRLVLDAPAAADLVVDGAPAVGRVVVPAEALA